MPTRMRQSSNPFLQAANRRVSAALLAGASPSTALRTSRGWPTALQAQAQAREAATQTTEHLEVGAETRTITNHPTRTWVTKL